MKRLLKYLATMFVALGGLASGAGANAATIFLIGSDVIGLHSDTNYINPVMNQLVAGAGGTNKILFINDYGRSTFTPYTAGIATFDFAAASSITSATNLSAYEAIYVDSGGTCCSDPASTLTGSGAFAKLASFVSGGGNLAVGDYAGSAAWDAILGFAGGPGVTGGGAATGPLCEDPGLSTPGGLAFGFAPSYTEGCFVHQTYNPGFWSSRGYFALQTDGAAGTRRGDWVTIASGFVDPAGVPEPASMLLLALGLVGLGFSRRKQA